MKTTIIIPDSLFHDLKKQAIERKQTVTALVIESLRKNLKDRKRQTKLAKLPTFKAGRPKVDITDRDSLYSVMDHR